MNNFFHTIVLCVGGSIAVYVLSRAVFHAYFAERHLHIKRVLTIAKELKNNG